MQWNEKCRSVVTIVNPRPTGACTRRILFRFQGEISRTVSSFLVLGNVVVWTLPDAYGLRKVEKVEVGCPRPRQTGAKNPSLLKSPILGEKLWIFSDPFFPLLERDTPKKATCTCSTNPQCGCGTQSESLSTDCYCKVVEISVDDTWWKVCGRKRGPPKNPKFPPKIGLVRGISTEFGTCRHLFGTLQWRC